MASIRELVESLRKAKETDSDEAIDEATDAIYGDPLGISVRDGWRTLGDKSPSDKEFRILLSTGGPATQISGDLDTHDDPVNIRLQAQDWFTPWINYEATDEEEGILQEYCQAFCFYED